MQLTFLSRSFPRSDGSIFYIAEVEGDVVGCVGCRRRENSMELSHLSVSPEHHRHGIGRGLVQAVVKHCRSVGAEQLDLTVLSDLHAAIKLYESIGFTKKREDDLGKGCVLYYFSLP